MFFSELKAKAIAEAHARRIPGQQNENQAWMPYLQLQISTLRQKPIIANTTDC